MQIYFMKYLSTVLCFLMFPCFCKAQELNIYSIYERQYAELLTSRGMPNPEIKNLLKQYSTSQLNSDDALAMLLKKLYSSERNIGVLFYFFNNDTLRRAYYSPGKILEVKSIPIKRATLMALGANINKSLNLYELTENRSPKLRGAIPLRKEQKTISFQKAIQDATSVLMPASFDAATKHLLIIPALNIGTIPFHLLQPYNNNTYLADKCSFTIVPSLVDLVALRSKILKKTSEYWDGGKLPPDFDSSDFSAIKQKNYALENVLFVANPAYPTHERFSFPNLPGAKKEIDSAKQYAHNYKVLTGGSATKDSVLKYLVEADVAYFATHGIADQEDPMGKSFLVLAGKDAYLTAKEIMNLRSDFSALPKMIILSACQTGLGKSLEAGTAGLARSFLLGGSNHVIMSLWNVDDDATAYLMSRFVYHLQTPHYFMPAEPLRLAIVDTKIRYKNPAQWASFSLFGIDY